MNGGVTKAQTRRSRARPSSTLQEKLLDAAADKSAELSQTRQEQPPVNAGLTQDAATVQAAKRRLDATSESNPLPAKRARLIRTDVRQPGVSENAEQADEVWKRSLTQCQRLTEVIEQTTLRQPKPRPPKRPSFLKEFIDPVHSHPRPESLHSFVTEWLESVGSNREKRCRSDSHLHRLDDDPVSWQLSRSAPEMGYTRDTDGFVVPPTPASPGSRSYRTDAGAGSVAPSDATGASPGSSRSSGRSLVEEPLYRDMNLAATNIYMRSSREKFPEHITRLVDYVRRDRYSPGPSPDQVWQDRALEELGMGAAESEIEKYFQTRIFPDCDPDDSLKRSDRQPMAKRTVPNTGSKLKVSTPAPDMLYGYNRRRAFPQQQTQLISMGTEMVANNQSLVYLFFVIEFKIYMSPEYSSLR